MTAGELLTHFNKVYGIKEKWPKTYEVDAVTYANCCQSVFDYIMACKEDSPYLVTHSRFVLLIFSLGTTKNGLMFRGVELILKS